VPDEVVSAVVAVLAGWGWAVRPAAVVSVPSRRRPLLVDSLARRIAEIGRLPYLGRLAGHPGTRRLNSAQWLAALWPAFTVPDDLRAPLATLSGPVLLVDDRADTRWTLTVAARLLREAGAPAVLPFTLAVTT